MTTIDVSASVLKWAQRRSGRTDDDMRLKFIAWTQWLTQEKLPSLAAVEEVARYTHVPMGYFFLPDPPVEEIPLTDFRFGPDTNIRSGDLLETIYLNQRRQAWYEDYLKEIGAPEALAFVGSARGQGTRQAAALISEALHYRIAERTELCSASDAIQYLIARFEELGGLVVFDSMVDNDPHRMLDIEDFQGFAIESATAPLVFVNSNDTENEQVSSLLHEFVHVWRGKFGVDGGGESLVDRTTCVNEWCDAVVTEIAAPTSDLRENFDRDADLTQELDRLSGRYGCSTLLILWKLRDSDLLESRGFEATYEAEFERLAELGKGHPQGESVDFCHNQVLRIGSTLSRAIIRDTKIGTTSMTEALRLLGFKQLSMFDTYASQLDMA